MKGLRKKVSWFTVCWVLFLLILPAASAQEEEACSPCPFKIELTTKALINPGDPVTMQIRVLNTMLERVITRHGFLDQLFYKWITIIGPDGRQISYRFAEATDYPSPPIPHKGMSWVVGEIIPPMGDPGFESLIVFDAREYYNLDGVYGPVTAQVKVPAKIFQQYDVIPSGAVLANLDEDSCGCNPLASNKVRINFVPPEPVIGYSIHVRVKTITIGDGTKPRVTKAPAPQGTSVRLYQLSDIPETEAYYPINWKTYSKISDDVSSMRSVNTDSNGIAKFENVPKGDYLIMADPELSIDFKHLGRLILDDDLDWELDEFGDPIPIIRNMVIIEKLKDNSKKPGKTKKMRGSELLITEPEFVEWDNTQEVYPVVFESVGDWDIETSIVPPEGFVSDFSSLDATVINATEAVQFTVTDVGSDWKPTKMKYKIKHKGKTKFINSEIGIKLSKKLAKKKGKSIYGDEDKNPKKDKKEKKEKKDKKEKK